MESPELPDISHAPSCTEDDELLVDLHGYGMMMPDYFWTGDTYLSLRALGIRPTDVTPRAGGALGPGSVPAAGDEDGTE